MTVKEATEKYGISHQKISQLVRGYRAKREKRTYYYAPKFIEGVHYETISYSESAKCNHYNCVRRYELNEEKLDEFFGVKNER